MKEGSHHKDPILTLLEEVVRPQMLMLKKYALISWFEVLAKWIENENNIKEESFDTQKVERLILEATEEGTKALEDWDRIFAFQILRSIPPAIIDYSLQLWDKPNVTHRVIKILTAFSFKTNANSWPKMEGETGEILALEEDKFVNEIQPNLTEKIGRSIGCAFLVDNAQLAYRAVGKGLKIKDSVFDGFNPKFHDQIMNWDGNGILLIPSIELEKNNRIDESIKIYEQRQEFFFNKWHLSGLALANDNLLNSKSGKRFWAAYPNPHKTQSIPIHFPSINQHYPNPSWYLLPDLDYESWIDRLKFYAESLKQELKLSIDELILCIDALMITIERQTQCGYLEPYQKNGQKGFFLNSPSHPEALKSAIEYFYSVLIRGTIKVRKSSFLKALESELTILGCTNSSDILTKFTQAFTGIPEMDSITNPIIFYELDDTTIIIDLIRMQDFLNSVFSIVINKQGKYANERGYRFEEEVNKYLVQKLSLIDEQIPWKPGQNIYRDGKNLGDVDFSIFYNGVLYNLDMKSWIRTEDYHTGHHHAISNRQKVLKKYLDKVIIRGEQLQREIEKKGQKVKKRRDVLVVNMPEYLSLEEPILWDNQRPNVMSPEEIVQEIKNQHGNDSSDLAS